MRIGCYARCITSEKDRTEVSRMPKDLQPIDESPRNPVTQNVETVRPRRCDERASWAGGRKGSGTLMSS